MTTNVYIENGYKDRDEYLERIAEDFGINLDTVHALAEVLGESEDFDGLITSIEDYLETSEYMQEFDELTDADGGL